MIACVAETVGRRLTLMRTGLRRHIIPGPP